MKNINNYTNFVINDQDAGLGGNGPEYYIDAIATDPNDTTKRASVTICACYTREMAVLVRSTLLVARFGSKEAVRIEECDLERARR